MRLLFLLAFFLSAPVLFHGQTAESTLDGLSLLHKEKRITKTIPFGSTVSIRMGKQKVRGVLEAYDAKSITIDGKAYALRDITWISVRTKWTKALAISMGVVGVGILTAGTVYLVGAGGLGYFSSGLIAGAGLGIGTMAIPIYRQGVKFYLDSDWKVLPQG